MSLLPAMADSFFSPAPNAGSPKEEDFDVAKVDLDREGLKRMSLAELREMKQKLRSVVSSAAGTAAIRTVCKRENKNCPREVSAKRRELKNQTRTVRRDPRFEDTCGQFDETRFLKDYDFLQEMRDKERKELAKSARKEKDPEKKEKLTKLKQRLDNQAASLKQRLEEKQVVEDLRNQEKERTGLPYVKKSQVQAALLMQKFQKLKKSGKLNKYLEKKRKKNVAKDRKRIE